MTALLMMDMSLPPVDSTPAFDPSLNTPLPSLNMPLHSFKTPLPLTSSPFHREVQLPDTRIKSDVKDVPSLITPSSHPLAKSTPGPKSMAEPSTWPSSCSGTKSHHFMADFH